MNTIVKYLEMWIELADAEQAVATKHVGHLKDFAREEEPEVVGAEVEPLDLDSKKFELRGLAESLSHLIRTHEMLFNATKRALTGCVSYSYHLIGERILKALDFVSASLGELLSGQQQFGPVDELLRCEVDQIVVRLVELRRAVEYSWIARKPSPERYQQSRQQMLAGEGVSVEDLIAEAK